MNYLKKLAEHWLNAKAGDAKFINFQGGNLTNLTDREARELGKNILDVYTRLEELEKKLSDKQI